MTGENSCSLVGFRVPSNIHPTSIFIFHIPLVVGRGQIVEIQIFLIKDYMTYTTFFRENPIIENL
jgi:hypothetical protein